MTKDEAIDELTSKWYDVQDRDCNCHISPPCGACVDGLGLSLEEYIELNLTDYYMSKMYNSIMNKPNIMDITKEFLNEGKN